MTALVVGIGGALGAIARHQLGEWVQTLAGDDVPWGTLTVNVVGSFALGFALVWLQATTSSSEARHFVAVGFLGSFTTFSTYSHETVTLAQSGELLRAGGYAAGSVAMGICGVLLGAAAAGLVLSGRA